METCVICNEDLVGFGELSDFINRGNKDKLGVIAKCNHKFHYSCLLQRYANDPHCSLCQTIVDESVVPYILTTDSYEFCKIFRDVNKPEKYFKMPKRCCKE